MDPPDGVLEPPVGCEPEDWVVVWWWEVVVVPEDAPEPESSPEVPEPESLAPEPESSPEVPEPESLELEPESSPVVVELFPDGFAEQLLRFLVDRLLNGAGAGAS